MTLKKYLKKRNFENTPEPSSSRKKPSSRAPFLNFCVQKHWARHLHYDFRLEHKGVLLSWAVPKGPSLNPNDKRLAIMVEDHPLEYRHFEGTIPKGNYGAGEVKIWDEGKYTVPAINDAKAMEQSIEEGLKKGHLEFELFGKKLKGEFALVKLKNTEKNWLLIKKKDDYIAEGSLDSEPSETSLKKERKKPSKEKKMPTSIKPMLATLVDKPFDGENWIFEIKFDGYRALAFIQKSVVQLRSRNDLSFNQMFPAIVNDLKKLKANAIFDGEVVVLDQHGKSQFQLMQNYQKTHKGNLFFYVFDLLFINGQDLRDKPLLQRKEQLKEVLSKADLNTVKYSEHIEENGIKFFEEAGKQNLEGVIGKEINSSYVSQRSKNWVKIKTHLRQEVVIGGFTKPRGSRKYFGALLLGIYEKNKLIYCGHTGGGFNVKLLNEVYEQLKPLVQKTCPFENIPKPNAPVTWVKPQLVCEISFQEWTSDGKVRQAIFQGMRMDKNAKKIVREVEEPLAKIAPSKGKIKNTDNAKFTNPDKIYWPKEGYTKGDLLKYYQEVAPCILSYLKNHPVMLHRYPNGIEGEHFYQKDSSQLHLPKWMQTVVIEHEKKPLKYLLIQDLRSLEYVINLGTIDIHPYLGKINHLDYPDYLVIDLDPEDISFEEVIKVAQSIHKVLEKVQVDNFCKTSGGRGLHVYVPLNGKYNFEQAKHFGELIAVIVNQLNPEMTSLVRSPKKRQKKIYLDVYQNNPSHSVIAPYSVRGKPFAPVSTPLDWGEVIKGLQPTDFTIKTVPDRLQKKGDLFKRVLGKGCNLEKVLDSIVKFFPK